MLVDAFGGGIKIAGVDRGAVVRQILTDTAGRMKISHGQPDPVTGNIIAVAGTVAANTDSLSDAVFYLYGTYGIATVIFEQSFNSTNGTDGTWFATNAIRQDTGALLTVTTANQIVAARIAAPGAAFVRVRATALASGTLNVAIVATTAATSPQINAIVTSMPSTAVTVGATATSIAKAEDAAHVSGDVGVPHLGVRAPTVPAAATSAAGDYGTIQIDSEGKTTANLFSVPENTWQYSAVIAVATDVAAKAAVTALRNYVTDITLSNSSAAAVLVSVKDGATVVWQVMVPANGTVDKSFNTPLRGTAATVVNVIVASATTNIYASLTGFVGA